MEKFFKTTLFRFLGILLLLLLIGFGLRAMYHYIPTVHTAVIHSSVIDLWYRLLMGPVSYLLGLTGIPHEIRYSIQAVQYFIFLPATNYSLYLWLPCLGITLMYIYGALVISFPGSWQRKTLFAGCGWIGIQVLNILRLYGVAMLLANDTSGKAYVTKNNWFVLNHEDLFNYIVIFLIFLIFVWYAAGYRSEKRKVKSEESLQPEA